MENAVSGSVDFNFTDEIKDLISTKEFEEDVYNSFVDKCYVINNKAPKPYWAFSMTIGRLIRISRTTEVLLLDKYDPNAHSIECFVNQNVVHIPAEYIDEIEWN